VSVEPQARRGGVVRHVDVRVLCRSKEEAIPTRETPDLVVRALALEDLQRITRLVRLWDIEAAAYGRDHRTRRVSTVGVLCADDVPGGETERSRQWAAIIVAIVQDGLGIEVGAVVVSYRILAIRVADDAAGVVRVLRAVPLVFKAQSVSRLVDHLPAEFPPHVRVAIDAVRVETHACPLTAAVTDAGLATARVVPPAHVDRQVACVALG
jgi:hypothetical protein